MEDSTTGVQVKAPTRPGFYIYHGGRQIMVFCLAPTLDGAGQWYAIFDNGSSNKCEWGYIEQALGVWDLVRLDAAVSA